MNQALFSSATEEWATPQDFFDALDAEFHFTLDPCSTDDNAKCEKHYTKADDGLSKDWTGERVFCNPPYGREMPKWIKKCSEHAFGGGLSSDVNSRPNRYESISRVHLRQGGNPIRQGPPEIWGIKTIRAFPVNGRRVW